MELFKVTAWRQAMPLGVESFAHGLRPRPLGVEDRGCVAGSVAPWWRRLATSAACRWRPDVEQLEHVLAIADAGGFGARTRNLRIESGGFFQTSACALRQRQRTKASAAGSSSGGPWLWPIRAGADRPQPMISDGGFQTAQGGMAGPACWFLS